MFEHVITAQDVMDIFHERELGENGDVLFELPLVNDHSNGLFVDARNEPISIANLRLANKRRRPENPVYPEKEYLAICIIKT